MSFSLSSSRGIALQLRETRFADAERALGISVPFPFAGWASWSAPHAAGVAVLSASFHGGTLRAVEWYLARGTIPLTPMDLGEISLEPGTVRLGDTSERLPAAFLDFAGNGPVYDRTFCAAAEGCLAFCMALHGRIVRIALYAP